MYSRFAGRSLDPIPWTTYFERELFLPAPDGSITYHAYLTSPAPSSGPGKPGGPLFITHHGAGSSGLSFAVLGAEIRKRLPTAGILSLDARGHGLTTVSATSQSGGEGGGNEGTPDLSLTTLASDLLAVLTLTQTAMHWPSLPSIILVGHSLGGAVVTEFASVLLPATKPTTTTTTTTTTNPLAATFPPSTTNPPSTATTTPFSDGTFPHPTPHPPPTTTTTTTNPSASSSSTSSTNSSAIDLLGYAVLDVVEGSAMDALQSMHAYLATRPAGFESLRDAVDWHVRSRTVRNAVSARASVPGLLVYSDDDESLSGRAGRLGLDLDEGGGEVVMEGVEHGDGGAGAGGSRDDGNVREARGGTGDGAGSGIGRKIGKGSKPWRWRTDLGKTQPFWEGWFTGLSKKFLTGRGGKMLLLAGTDRLDTELTIGQMQGMSLSVSFSFPYEGGPTNPLKQASMPSKYSLRLGTLSTKTYLRRRQLRWSTSTGGTTGVRWCYRRRCPTC